MSDTLGIRVDSTYATKQHDLGRYWFDSRTGKGYRYVQANGAIAQYAPVKLGAGYDCAAAGINDAVFGVAQVALADNEFGWVQVLGECTAKVVTSLAALALVSRAAGTSGQLQALVAVDEGSTTAHGVGDQSDIGQTLTAEASNLATVFLRA